MAFLRSDVARFCGEIADLAPAVRLARLAELKAMLDDVTSQAMAAAMADARSEGWGLRRIGRYAGVSHEQVRRTLAPSEAQPITPEVKR
ncbi:hypothetical protein [Nonomuraea sp. SBT364]|uniref:hypothetical protein n=1 Tax=Nonomuraea sp. SBT364 TaxID=1580530 RepID=UPI001E4F23E3|nr:hypothetical protein [Nonomuraea sp. SBT364]